MPVLQVDEFGCFVGKEEELVQVRKGGAVVAECPLADLEALTLEGRGISLSVDLIAECATRGIPIDCVGFDGEPYAKIMTPALTATVSTRRAQLRACDDQRGLQIAAAIITAKLANQRSLLLYFGKYRKRAAPELQETLATVAGELSALKTQVDALAGPSVEAVRPALLNLEGRAAAAYWAAVWQLLPPALAPAARDKRGAEDPVNCLLNYGYGILLSRCWSAVLLAGLDPYGGFVHVDRPGKPSLVLDLQDVFRQPVVDRTVIALLNKGFKVAFEEPGRLTRETRRALAAEVVGRLETVTPFAGRRLSLQSIIVAQARSLAVAVRGESPLQPFLMRW